MDCIDAFKLNERKFYKIVDDENNVNESFDLYDTLYNFKSVICPNCSVGFQVDKVETTHECPMCFEQFTAEAL